MIQEAKTSVLSYAIAGMLCDQLQVAAITDVLQQYGPEELLQMVAEAIVVLDDLDVDERTP